MNLDPVYKVALDQVNQAVCICDPDGNLLYINSAAGRLACLSPGDMQGKKFLDVFSCLNGESLSSIQKAISEKARLQECARVQLGSGDTLLRIDVSPLQLLESTAGSVISLSPIEAKSSESNKSGTDSACSSGELTGKVESNGPEIDCSDPECESGRAEREIDALRCQMESILGASGTVISIIDPDFNIRYIDPSWKKRLGDHSGLKCYEYIHGFSAPCKTCRSREAFLTKETQITDEVICSHPEKIFQVTSMPFQDDQGNWLVAQVGVDITARKQAEKDLRSAHQQLLSIIEFLPDATFVVDKDKKVIAWNRAIEEMTGVLKSDVLNRGDHAYAVPFYGESIPMLLDLIGVEDKELESRYQYVDRIGDTIYAEVFVPSLYNGKGAYVWAKASPLIDAQGEIIGSVESIRDITEKKTVELELQKRDILLSGVAVAANILLTVPDYSSAVNHALEILGLAAEVDRVYIFENYDIGEETLTSQKFEWSRPGIEPQIDNPDLQDVSYDRFFSNWYRALASGDPVSSLVRSLSEKDRAILEPMDIRSLLVVPIFIDSRFWGFIGFDDCTSERIWTKSETSILMASAGSIGAAIVRKMTEERLRLLESAVNNTDEAVVIASPNTSDPFNPRIVYVNEAFTRITGYGLDEAVGKSPNFLHGPNTDKIPLERVNNAIERQERIRVELINYRKDGSEFWQELNIVPVKNEKGDVTHWVSLQRDATERKRAEDALRETRDYLESLIGYANAPIIVWDPSFKITRFNHASEHLTGRLAEAVLGQNLEMLFPVESRDESLVYISRALSGERWETVEIPILRADGSVRTVLWNSATLYSEDGTTVIAAIAQGQDITERKQAEARIQFQASLLDQVRNSVIATDTEGKIVYWNRFAEELHQWKEEEVLGKNIADITVPGCAADLSGRIRSMLLEVGHYEDEIPVKRKDGSIFLGLCSFSIVKDANDVPVGMIVVCSDITERKRAEAELLKAKDLALEATRAKSQFLANMSHEIRTPMNAVIGMSGLLLNTDLTTEQQECVEIIRASGDVLLEIINDILDLSKIEGGNLELESQPFDLVECIEESVDLVAPAALEKDLSISYSIDRTVQKSLIGDVTKLRQILVNLLANAVKFTDSGDVSVHVISAIKDGSREIQLAVSDTGIGIPKSQVSRIFQSFIQVDSSITRKYGGTGLGLAISRSLVELMGGRIWAESEPGVGSTFYFAIPEKVDPLMEDISSLERKRMPSKKAFAEPDSMFAKRHPLRILLVEDNLINQKVATRMLERIGYRADVTANGLEALQALERLHYDVVLMDVQMPEMDGLDATKHIRNMFPENQPYVIAMTAHALKGDREICYDAGMDDYVSKPVKMQELQAALEGASLRIKNKPPLDPAVLASLKELQMEGEPDIIVELAELFISRAPQRLRAIRDAVERGEATALFKEAHNLKSSSANLGASRLSIICKDMEQIGRSGKTGGASELIGLAELEYERVKAALEAEMKLSTQA